jgi:hypothetical protein
MVCPYCGNEMEKGLIQSPREIAWLKGEKKAFLGKAAFHSGSVILSESSILKGSAVAAYLCRNCQKVLIDYAEPSELNR